MKRAAIASLLLLAGCGRPDGDDPFSAIARHLIDDRGAIGAFLLEGIAWAAAGLATGVALGVVAFLVVRALGGYRWEWRHAKWLRALAAVVTVVAFGASLCLVGLLEGALRGARLVVRESKTAKELFPVAGDAGADLIASVHLAAASLDRSKPVEQLVPADELARFREGKWELDVPDLLARVDRAGDAAIAEVTSKVEADVFERAPSLRGGATEKLLAAVLPFVARGLISRAVDRALDEHDLDVDPRSFRDGLLEEARRAGDPRTISRPELSAYVVRSVLEPGILGPLRRVVRGHQLALVAALAAIVAVPIALFRLAEWLGRRSPREPSPPLQG